MPSDIRPSVSLIVPTYRREQPLVDCLRCALRQDYDPLEILIIDQTEAHEPETAKFLDELPSHARLIRQDPPGAVGARNRGLDEAKGERLIFIDDDTTFEKDFVEAHVAAHRAGAEVVQGRVIEPGRGVSYRAQWMLPWLRVIGSNTFDKPGPTNTITGCNFSLSLEAVKKVGQFDEKFSGVLIREDADYGARCAKAGIKMSFDPKACLVHHRAVTGGVDADLKAANRLFEPDVLRNELYFARKHFNWLMVWQYKKRILRRMKRAASQNGSPPGNEFKILIKEADFAARRLLRD